MTDDSFNFSKRDIDLLIKIHMDDKNRLTADYDDLIKRANAEKERAIKDRDRAYQDVDRANADKERAFKDRDRALGDRDRSSRWMELIHQSMVFNLTDDLASVGLVVSNLLLFERIVALYATDRPGPVRFSDLYHELIKGKLVYPNCRLTRQAQVWLRELEPTADSIQDKVENALKDLYNEVCDGQYIFLRETGKTGFLIMGGLPLRAAMALLILQAQMDVTLTLKIYYANEKHVVKKQLAQGTFVDV